MPQNRTLIPWRYHRAVLVKQGVVLPVLAGNQTAPTVRLGEVMAALSRALDLTEGQPPGHCVRCAWIGLNMAATMGLSERDTDDLYFTLLMKDLGCSSNAARICALYATDDLAFKNGFKTVDGSIGQALTFVLRHTALKAGLSERVRTLFSVLREGGNIAHDLIATRCERGAEIAAMMHFGPRVCDSIHALDEHWDGGGLPDRRAGADIPLFARIALLAQVVDVFHVDGGREAALAEVRCRAGKWFDPELVEVFLKTAEHPGLWAGLREPGLEQVVFAMAPAQASRMVDEDFLDDIARAFARVIDAKSPFTHGHSERVALYTDMICAELDYTPAARRWMKRAALLHDVGKLGVSNEILDKPGKLTEAEFARIKQHATYTEEILSEIAAFSDMAVVAAAHHERLDGKGYPKGLSAPDLSRDMRVIAVADIFDALTADRPYRAAMPMEKVAAILDEMAGPAIDPACWRALQRAIDKN